MGAVRRGSRPSSTCTCPTGSVEPAKRLCGDHHIPVAEIWTLSPDWRPDAVHHGLQGAAAGEARRAARPPRRAPAKPAARKAPGKPVGVERRGRAEGRGSRASAGQAGAGGAARAAEEEGGGRSPPAAQKRK